MLEVLKNTKARDRDFPPRTWEMAFLQKVLEGRAYDVLKREFHEERTDAGEYIPLKDRRPSVRYNLCRTVVEDSVTLVFSEGHFPTLECQDAGIRDSLLALVKETRLARVMTDAAMAGSTGSVVILLRVLKNRVFFEHMTTEYLTPAWMKDAPDTLESVTEQFKARGKVFRDAGYQIADDDLEVDFWFRRVWDVSAETWYLPWRVVTNDSGNAPPVPKIDTERSVTHGFGFVPMVWIKNLPGPSSTGAPCDGASTFKDAISTQIEIEYQLSQVGRGLKYAADPTLLIKEPAFAEQSEFVRSPANALVVSQQGDAKLIEINGTAAEAVLGYVGFLRKTALEAMHGNRTDADKLSAAQSGRAMELMHQALIWLADHLRQSYGEDGLLPLIGMVAGVSRARGPLLVKGKKFPVIPDDVDVTLRWPPWFPPTGEDRVQEANGLVTLRVGGLISRETGVKAVAETWDIEDVPHELGLIAGDEKQIIAGTQLPPTGQQKQTGPGPNGNQGKGGDQPG